MSLNFTQKQAVVSEVNEIAVNAQTAIAAEYNGLTVQQMTELRSKARNDGVTVRVVKNTLAKRALVGTNFECLNDSLIGPLLLVFSGEDPGAGARLVKAFTKENDKLVTRVLVVSGVLRPAEDLDLLAKMPTLDGARSMFLSVLQSPQTNLVRVLAAPSGQFVRVLSAYLSKQSSA
jgi:large subunit ribosomal protein L10